MVVFVLRKGKKKGTKRPYDFSTKTGLLVWESCFHFKLFVGEVVGRVLGSVSVSPTHGHALACHVWIKDT